MSFDTTRDRIDAKEKLLIILSLMLGVCFGMIIGYNWGIQVGAGLGI